MTLRARLVAATSNSGDRIHIAERGVTCIVGGNNAGKSQLLRDIYNILNYDSTNHVVLSDLEVEKSGADSDFRNFLEAHAGKHVEPPGVEPTYGSPQGGSSLNLAQFKIYFNMHENRLMGAAPFLCWHATAGSLVTVATGTTGPSLGGISRPLLSELLRYGDLEQELSDLALEIFGEPLVLDRLGESIRLRVGDPKVEVPLLNRPTREYADAVAKLASLEHQGDGMKAFIGLALSVLAGSEQILLVDEPEAFLHPAQARALGRWLAAESIARDKQVVIATHDRDLVLGMLDASVPVTMVRLIRTGEVTSMRELVEGQLSTVWADPVLKYSNILQGLFHRRVVICEADADCRFYSAVLDSSAVEKNVRSIADNTLFVPAGGKQRAATLASALSMLGVEVYSIPDFDILRDKKDVRGLLEASGGTWTDEMDSLYMTVVRSIGGASAWDSAKHQGLNFLASGEVYLAGERLLDLLKEDGVLVVRGGEMEDFDKSIGLHGSAWVTSMLETNGHLTRTTARDFLQPLTEG